MAMTDAQTTAFKAASGNTSPDMTYLLCVGSLVALLFLWAGWALVDIWAGWANQKVRDAAMVRFAIRATLLVIVCIWMFAS